MPDPSQYPLLATIHSPDDLKKLSISQLPALCDELRAFLIQSVSKTGGHLGANLGTIELTVAVHYVYQAPTDQIIWDVGHQTYGHKILTGRAKAMHSMRKNGGLSGFPKRKESPYDSFGVGHSSTSISAGLGMALANRLLGDDSKTVAIIGDGAMTAGLAFEALNHGGDTEPDLLVILNDNDMSISPNVGALNKYLARLLTGSVMQGARTSTKNLLKKAPMLHRLASRLEELLKGLMVPATLFEELGFKYYGPVDGHDVIALTQVIQNMKDLQGPHFLHVITKKGHGYAPAKADALALHAVAPFDPETGQSLKPSSEALTYTRVFGNWLCQQAEADSRLVAITPAMREGSGLVEFQQRFPNRYFDVGIAEQHAVTLAAGMACRGLKPVVAIYSTFLQRAYDQLVHDVALQNLDVLFAVDRAGIVGGDGPTHAGSFDYSFSRCLPNVIIMAPADEAECKAMLSTGFEFEGPAIVRYPRGTGPGSTPSEGLSCLSIGQSQNRRQGQGVAILAFGSMVAPCEAVAQALDASLINMRFVQPLDNEAITHAAQTHSLLVTVEENTVAGGAGSAVGEYLNSTALSTPLLQLGLANDVDEHGDAQVILEDLGLDAAGIEASIRARLAQS